MNYNLIEINNNNFMKFDNKIIIFNFKKYFDFLLKGYTSNKEIETQFILDSKRNNIKYNHFIIKDIDKFNLFLKKKYNYYLLNFLKLLLISLTTVSASRLVNIVNLAILP